MQERRTPLLWELRVRGHTNEIAGRIAHPLGRGGGLFALLFSRVAERRGLPHHQSSLEFESALHLVVAQYDQFRDRTQTNGSIWINETLPIESADPLVAVNENLYLISIYYSPKVELHHYDICLSSHRGQGHLELVPSFLYFTIEVSTNCLLHPGLIVIIGLSFLLRVTDLVGHDFEIA